MVALHLVPQGHRVPRLAGEEQVVAVGHGHLAGLVLGTVGAVEGGLDPPPLELGELALHLAPQARPGERSYSR